MIGWIKELFMNKDDPKRDRDRKVIERLSKAEHEIDRAKRLLKASGYYNDRLEGTHQYGRNT